MLQLTSPYSESVTLIDDTLRETDLSRPSSGKP